MATITDAIRDAIRNGPMSLDRIMDVIGDITDRSTARTIISQRKRAGEFSCAIEDGKPVYAYVEGYKPNYSPKSKAGTNQNAEGSTQPPPPVATSKKPKLETPHEKGRVERLHRKRRDFFVAAESADKTLKALLFSRQTAADALEVYVHSCVDPEIYQSLQYAVNASQAAIDKFSAGGAE